MGLGNRLGGRACGEGREQGPIHLRQGQSRGLFEREPAPVLAFSPFGFAVPELASVKV